ncbi:MAG: AMP-binding protein [Gammaproteobacteria bacterium]|nr:AMP-binding protein [Gammaproteobacteria bacterium]
MKENYDALSAISGLNYVELSPVSFLSRASETYADHPGVVYGNRQYNWQQVSKRCNRLASALSKLGVGRGTTVSLLAANTPELVEGHYGIPMCGGVINSINTRLEAETIAYILEHSDAKVLITDTHFSAAAKAALSQLSNPPIVIDIVDEQSEAPAGNGETLGVMNYEALLETGDENSVWGPPDSEWDAIALNYTSGTSGQPKGVVYHHRGSYLMTMGTIAAWQITKHPRYLYTVPMFHCNGWGHVWTMAVMAGTLICNRVISAEVIFDAIKAHQITHFGAAPIILSMLANAPVEMQYKPDHTVQVMTAGAPPPSKVLEKTEELGFNVIHVYGLTETYGHVVYCDWKTEWSALTIEEQAEIKARQGVRLQMMESVDVISLDDGKPVSRDGETIGEIVFKGNTIMKGYYKSPQATEEGFKNGWFHSGDLAVIHGDGYIEIKDRLKDIIISGGENISSIEVESVLYKFPKVSAAAVVAKPDEKWGETPCAFVELKAGETSSEEEIIAFCKESMAGFKRPKQVVIMELPKTSTGKIQKFKLRDWVKQGKV